MVRPVQGEPLDVVAMRDIVRCVCRTVRSEDEQATLSDVPSALEYLVLIHHQRELVDQESESPVGDAGEFVRRLPVD